MSELTPGFIVAHGHRLEDLTDVAVKFTQNYAGAGAGNRAGAKQWYCTVAEN